jgi:hypothetical protein
MVFGTRELRNYDLQIPAVVLRHTHAGDDTGTDNSGNGEHSKHQMIHRTDLKLSSSVKRGAYLEEQPVASKRRRTQYRKNPVGLAEFAIAIAGAGRDIARKTKHTKERNDYKQAVHEALFPGGT